MQQVHQFRIGERVLVDGGSNGHGRTGIIRYYGPTQFREGQWVGIELDEATGKNDGSVDGVAYFKCGKDFGLFVHPSKVSRLADPLVAALMLNHKAEPKRNEGITSTSTSATTNAAGAPASKPSTISPSPFAPPSLTAPVPPPPFQLSEMSARIVELSKEFGKENVGLTGATESTAKASNVIDSDVIIDQLPNTVTVRSKNAGSVFDESIAMMRNPLLLTPKKQQQQQQQQYNQYTPASASKEGGLAHELAKRQAEVNHIRRHVEPLLVSARAIVEQQQRSGSSTATAEQASNLQAIVIKLSAHMRDYDKVISRYERQLSKILEHQNNQHHRPSTAEQEELRHELDLSKARLIDAEEKAKSLEARLAVAMRASDQQERSMRNSTAALFQELSDENAALQEKLLRLEAEASVTAQGSSSTNSQSVMIEELRRELDIERKEKQLLRQQLEKTTVGITTTVAATTSNHEEYERLRKDFEHLSADYRDLSEAKFKEGRYFEEQVKDLRADLGKSQNELATQKALVASLQHEIDTKLDAVYDGQNAQKAGLAEALVQVETLKGQLGGVEAEKTKLEIKCMDLQGQLATLSAKLAESTRRAASIAQVQQQPQTSSAELEEARKQIAALEQELLHHTESLAKQKDSSKIVIQEGLKEMQASLKGEQSRRSQAERRLAQVEHEKALIEEELERLRPLLQQSTTKDDIVDSERVREIKGELAKKGPQSQQFALLANFFASLPRTLTGKPAAPPLKLEGIRDAYKGVKEGLERLESVHDKTVDKLQASLALNNLPVMEGEEDDVERTPTVNRRRITEGHSANRVLFKQATTANDIRDSSRGFRHSQF